MKTFMNRRRGIGAVIFLAILGLIGVGLAYDRYATRQVPEEFKNARLQGALISQNIVDLSNQMAGDLARVNHLDQEQDYDSAIELADTLIAQSTEIRLRAQNLSKELKVMTQSLDKIYSSSARESALNSINARVEMINSLLAYSDRLTDLLNALKDRFAGNNSQHTSNVVDLVNKINEEVSQVNQFNQKATDEMNVFDEIVRGR